MSSAKNINRGNRYTKTELVYLNSKDASINSSGDHTFYLNTYPIMDGLSISLYTFNILWNWSNVTPTTNKIRFNEGGPNITATIPVGQYDILSLITAIGTQMTASGGQTYTASFDIVTNKITITGSAFAFSIILTGSTANNLIGLTSNISSTLIAPFTLTFQDLIDLLPIKEIQVRIPDLLQTVESGNNSSICSAISLSGFSFGSEISTSQSGVDVELQKKTLNEITISIVSQDGFSPEVDELIFSLSFQITKF